MSSLGSVRCCRSTHCCVVLALAFGACVETRTTDADASATEPAPRRSGPVSPSAAYEPMERCTDSELLRAHYPNHVLVVSDGLAVPVRNTDVEAELIDAASGGVLRLEVNATFRGASLDDTRGIGTAGELGLQVELDAALVQEANAELLLPIDISVSATNPPEYRPFGARPSMPGNTHAPAVLSVLATRYCPCDDATSYRVTGMLRVRRLAQRLIGSAELTLEHLSLAYASGPTQSMTVTACFDAFIEDATDIAACDRCGLDLVASQEISDCGRQLRSRSAEVTECVRAKLASSEPFQVRVQVAGIDSQVVLLWQRTADGVMRRFDYDSTICGGAGCYSLGCGPAVFYRTCDAPELIPDESAANDGSDELIVCGVLYGGTYVCHPASEPP